MRALFVAAGAALCLLGTPANAATKVRIGYTPVPDAVAIHLAKQEGIFERHGIDAELVYTQNSTLAPSLVAGTLEIGGLTGSVLVQAVDSGIDLVVVSGMSRMADDGSVGILVRSGETMREAKDFVGKTFAISGLGAALHVVTQNWLMKNGVRPEQVNFVEIPFNAQFDMMKSGKIDAVATVEPILGLMVEKKVATVAVDLTKSGIAGIAPAFYVAPRQWADAHPDAVKKVQAAIAEATELARKDPQKTRDAFKAFLKMPPPALARLAVPHLTVDVTTSDIDFWQDVMIAQKFVSKRRDASGLIWRP